MAFYVRGRKREREQQMQEKVSIIVPCYNEQEALPYINNMRYDRGGI